MKTVKDNNLLLNSLKETTTTIRKISTVLFYQVCADTVKAKQNIGAGYDFFAHQTS